ncbi:DUF397 domain-containing protein [Streptomyces sp. URMC 126]|uniref:DUF397 domain-containing protein n=1 Tax=Streptomyces sp. URMC 126 TaxID=3423401 RepID=UPI003F1A8395
MRTIPAHAAWKKSTYSAGNGGQCLEWAPACARAGFVPVRDSKRPTERALAFPVSAWSAFLTSVMAR